MTHFDMMDIEEVLKWTDRLVFEKTGQHLSDLQKAVVEGTWQGKKYPDIAKTCYRTHHRIKQVARELWQLMSQELGEEVKQSNFRSVLEQNLFSNISTFRSDYVQIVGDINFCREHCPYPKTAKNSSPATVDDTNKAEKLYDLTEAPECDRYYDRAQELTTLKQWILEDNIRIIALIGLSGIGKTPLTMQLIEEIKDNFDRIIWRNLSPTLTLQTLQTDLNRFFTPEAETNGLSIIENLRARRCLIILNDLQEIFASGELAGTYLPDHQNYGKFFQQIARSPHKSCLLLLSWEKPIDIANTENVNHYCRTLQLHGLADSAREIFQERGLSDEDRWLELTELYSGNPLWLNVIANTIQELFSGSVAGFLSSPAPFLGNLEPILEQHYQRLSELEKEVIF